MPRFIKANQATAARRRCYFHLVSGTDGLTAATGEAAGQPQISTNGAAWTDTGIGTLTHIGNGRYYADVTQAAVATAGDVIETRYKSANTAETPGDTFQVVALDLDTVIENQVWDAILDGSHHITAASAGWFMQKAASFAEGTVQAATATTLTLDSFMSSVDDYYKDCLIGITTGTGLQQLRIIQSYVGATRQCVLASDRPWIVTPVALVSTWEIYTAGPASVTQVSTNSITNIGAPIQTTLTTINNTLNTVNTNVATVNTAVAGSQIVVASPTNISAAGAIFCRRGDDLSIPITGLGILSGRTKLWFTVKLTPDSQADSAAKVQIVEGTGLVTLNGAAGTAGQGSLTVTDATNGAATLVIAAAATAALGLSNIYRYDIQVLLSSGVKTLAEGWFEVVTDVTRATT